jgi:dephospho-CoA kinase
LDSDGDTTNINSDLTDNAVNEGNSNDISKEGSVTPTEDTDNKDSTVNPPVVDNNTKSDTSKSSSVAANNTNNSTQPSKDKSSISISKKSVVRGSNLHIYLKDSNGKGISGKSITVKINGKTYTKTTDKNGAVVFNFSSLLGKYSLKVNFNGDADYLSSTGTFTVNIYRLDPKIVVSSSSVARSKKFVGYLKKSNGNAFAGKKIIITFKGKKYTKTTDSKGKFTLKINNPAGKYKMSIKFAGSTTYNPATKTFTLTVYRQKTNITVASKNVVKGKYLYAYLKTNKGVALVNKPVIIKFNNKKTFYKTTNSNGRVSLKINSEPGSYSTKVIYKGNGYYKPTTYSFKTRSFIDKTKITVASSSVIKGKYFYAYLKNSNNKVISGEKVVISINGAKYDRTTDKNGRVGLKINCNPKTYAVTVKHSASKKYMASSKSLNLKVEKAGTNTAGTGNKITQKTIVIDTDVISKSLLEKDSIYLPNIMDKLSEKWGQNIVDTFYQDGIVKRNILGNYIFSDDNKRQDLNNLMHPIIKKIVISSLKRQKNAIINNTNKHQVIFVAVPLLFEARYDDLFDEVLIVDCDENNIIERLMKRDNISVELAKQKIASQLSTEEKIAYANKNKVKYYLLENKGSILELYTSIDKYLDTLK